MDENGSAPTTSLEARLQESVRRLTVAVEDIVALAHSGGEARQRLASMERRAIAALSGTDALPPIRQRRAGSGEELATHPGDTRDS